MWVNNLGSLYWANKCTSTPLIPVFSYTICIKFWNPCSIYKLSTSPQFLRSIFLSVYFLGTGEMAGKQQMECKQPSLQPCVILQWDYRNVWKTRLTMCTSPTLIYSGLFLFWNWKIQQSDKYWAIIYNAPNIIYKINPTVKKQT